MDKTDLMANSNSRLTGKSDFWGEIAPCEHLLQIYEADDDFLDALEGFVAEGLAVGDSVVIIATSSHREGLGQRLARKGIDLGHEASEGNYIALDATEALEEFITGGWPDDDKFFSFVNAVLCQARANGRPVRAFGEMVAVLWGRGHNAATVRLENLWQKICHEQSFALFCAYPKIGFTDYALKSLEDIRSVHSRVIA